MVDRRSYDSFHVGKLFPCIRSWCRTTFALPQAFSRSPRRSEHLPEVERTVYVVFREIILRLINTDFSDRTVVHVER